MEAVTIAVLQSPGHGTHSECALFCNGCRDRTEGRPFWRPPAFNVIGACQMPEMFRLVTWPFSRPLLICFGVQFVCHVFLASLANSNTAANQSIRRVHGHVPVMIASGCHCVPLFSDVCIARAVGVGQKHGFGTWCIPGLPMYFQPG